VLVGELARFFRSVLWQTAGAEPPSPDPADRRAVAALAQRLEPDEVFALADRCMLADYQLQRRAYLPLVLLSLMNDVGRCLRAG
jgi:DNA polymerase-3 subunit delta'